MGRMRRNRVRRLGAAIVIHTAGPFQGQSYAVPQACIGAGAHYLDLADGRAFVCGIKTLDAAARYNDVLVVSGASTLPALSSAVVDSLRSRFSSIDSIDHGITSGAKPPGQATMTGVLAYAGKPLRLWRAGEWRSAFGWQGITRRRYPSPVNARWIAHCDVPDLELFPERYRPVRSVQFRAGVGLAGSMFGIWAASWLVRAGLLRTLVTYVPNLHRAASALERYGSKCSAISWSPGSPSDSRPAPIHDAERRRDQIGWISARSRSLSITVVPIIPVAPATRILFMEGEVIRSDLVCIVN